VAGAAAVWLSHHGRDSLIARYGKGNLARVFRHVLMTSGVAVPLPPGWDRTRYGAGILDVERLVSSPLPAAVPAPKKRVVRPGAPKRLSMIESLFPDVAPGDVDRAVASLLGTSVAGLPRVLDEVGDELAVHLGVDAQLREEVLRRVKDATQPSPKRKGLRKKVRPEAASTGHVRRAASIRLRKRLTAS
jgi:hypothetical protein